MKALIVYESLFGNTELVAQAIADGLRDTFEVTVTDVATMPRAFGMDLIVVGGGLEVVEDVDVSAHAVNASRGIRHPVGL